MGEVVVNNWRVVWTGEDGYLRWSFTQTWPEAIGVATGRAMNECHPRCRIRVTKVPTYG